MQTDHQFVRASGLVARSGIRLRGGSRRGCLVAVSALCLSAMVAACGPLREGERKG